MPATQPVHDPKSRTAEIKELIQLRIDAVQAIIQEMDSINTNMKPIQNQTKHRWAEELRQVEALLQRLVGGNSKP